MTTGLFMLSIDTADRSQPCPLAIMGEPGNPLPLRTSSPNLLLPQTWPQDPGSNLLHDTLFVLSLPSLSPLPPTSSSASPLISSPSTGQEGKAGLLQALPRVWVRAELWVLQPFLRQYQLVLILSFFPLSLMICLCVGAGSPRTKVTASCTVVSGPVGTGT